MILDDDIIKKHGVMFAAIYAVVSNNPNITQAEIAALCHTSLRTVQRTLDELHQLHYIEIKMNKPNPNTYQIMERTTSPTTMTYGEFGLVHLTGPEFKKLQEKYPKIVIEHYIQKVDTYMYNNKSNKINTYPTHYATIKMWIDDDVRRNGGYTVNKKTKTLEEIKQDEIIKDMIEIAMIDAEKLENSESSDNLPSTWDVAEFYSVSLNSFSLHKNLHEELIAIHRPSKIKVPRDVCFGVASEKYLDELQLKLNPNTPKVSWGILHTEAMCYIELYRKYYIYLDELKEKAKTQSQEFLDYVGYHEGDEY